MADAFEHDISRTLRDAAMALPETTEGASCVNRAFKAGGKKNFLFLGEKGETVKFMVRVADPDAVAAASADWAGEWPVGKTGWLNAKFPAGEPPPADVLARWVDESWRVLAPKKLVAQHDR